MRILRFDALKGDYDIFDLYATFDDSPDVSWPLAGTGDSGDEERRQAVVDLVSQILTCPNFKQEEVEPLAEALNRCLDAVNFYGETEITEAQWEAAYGKLQEDIRTYAEIPTGAMALNMFMFPLRNRYIKGERTPGLYKEMMEDRS